MWIREGRITARRFGTKRGMRILLSELKRFEESSIIRSATKEQRGGEEAIDDNRMPRLAAALHT